MNHFTPFAASRPPVPHRHELAIALIIALIILVIGFVLAVIETWGRP